MRELDETALMGLKNSFNNLVMAINREGFDKARLLAKLENSDFYIAPASTKFHNNFKGGLVDHCLNVYYNMINLISMKHLENEIPQDSVAIVALFHDLSKMNFYEIGYRNKKVYSESGSKRDEGGYFDWVTEKSYAVRPESERFIYGNHEETSEFMLRQYIPLTYEESAAILNHHGGIGNDSTGMASTVFGRYNLATLLHVADLMATYIDENNSNE